MSLFQVSGAWLADYAALNGENQHHLQALGVKPRARALAPARIAGKFAVARFACPTLSSAAPPG
jgi:hypothetical protein